MRYAGVITLHGAPPSVPLARGMAAHHLARRKPVHLLEHALRAQTGDVAFGQT